MSNTKVEFAVQMYDEKCAQEVRKALEGFCTEIEINDKEGRVIISTSQPWSLIQSKVEHTGRKAVLSGIGKQSAVALISRTGCDINKTSIQGVVRFSMENVNERGLVVDGVVDGLKPGLHGIHIHETGDVSDGCASVGEHFNPLGTQHGAPENDENQRHAGDLGNIRANEGGRATFRFKDSVLNVSDIIGRALVITSHEDDFGRGKNKQSSTDGNAGDRIACGIIARSAGIMQNYKKICACDGVNLWDERNQPVAGGIRGQNIK